MSVHHKNQKALHAIIYKEKNIDLSKKTYIEKLEIPSEVFNRKESFVAFFDSPIVNKVFKKQSEGLHRLLSLARYNKTLLEIWIDIFNNNEYIYEELSTNYDEAKYLPVNIEHELEDFFSKSEILNNEITFETRIHNFMTQFGNKHPIIKSLITYLFLPVLIGVIVANITATNNEIPNVGLSVNQTVKEISYEFNILNSIDDTYNYRVVIKDDLKVYKDSNRKSCVIGTLDQFTLVKLTYKNKNWSYVEYYDEYDRKIQGWVFTRYIERLK